MAVPKLNLKSIGITPNPLAGQARLGQTVTGGEWGAEAASLPQQPRPKPSSHVAEAPRQDVPRKPHPKPVQPSIKPVQKQNAVQKHATNTRTRTGTSAQTRYRSEDPPLPIKDPPKLVQVPDRPGKKQATKDSRSPSQIGVAELLGTGEAGKARDKVMQRRMKKGTPESARYHDTSTVGGLLGFGQSEPESTFASSTAVPSSGLKPAKMRNQPAFPDAKPFKRGPTPKHEPHIGRSSSAIQARDQAQRVSEHVSNHYRRISKAKSTINNQMPDSMYKSHLGRQRLRKTDPKAKQLRREKGKTTKPPVTSGKMMPSTNVESTAAATVDQTEAQIDTFVSDLESALVSTQTRDDSLMKTWRAEPICETAALPLNATLQQSNGWAPAVRVSAYADDDYEDEDEDEQDMSGSGSDQEEEEDEEEDKEEGVSEHEDQDTGCVDGGDKDVFSVKQLKIQSGQAKHDIVAPGMQAKQTTRPSLADKYQRRFTDLLVTPIADGAPEFVEEPVQSILGQSTGPVSEAQTDMCYNLASKVLLLQDTKDHAESIPRAIDAQLQLVDGSNRAEFLVRLRGLFITLGIDESTCSMLERYSR
eukprot:m.135593 g.135593  ORF g.135593 m.135593 type:complete len:588 (+) comp13979_c2_seq2:86-1849(+)